MRPSARELWIQAGGGTPGYDPGRYGALLREHKHILVPGDDGYAAGVRAATCGWQPYDY